MVSSYMYRGLVKMRGFENPASGKLRYDSNRGLVIDDNTGDLLRIYGLWATAQGDFYKHGRTGVHALYGDGSVRWIPDPLRYCYVPAEALNDPAQYARIWQWVDEYYEE